MDAAKSTQSRLKIEIFVAELSRNLGPNHQAACTRAQGKTVARNGSHADMVKFMGRWSSEAKAECGQTSHPSTSYGA